MGSEGESFGGEGQKTTDLQENLNVRGRGVKPAPVGGMPSRARKCTPQGPQTPEEGARKALHAEFANRTSCEGSRAVRGA